MNSTLPFTESCSSPLSPRTTAVCVCVSMVRLHSASLFPVVTSSVLEPETVSLKAISWVMEKVSRYYDAKKSQYFDQVTCTSIITM